MNILSRELDRELYQAHKEWLRAGGKGAGRLVVDGKSLIGFVASALDLRGAKFIDCNLTKSNLSNCHLHQAELLGCDVSKSNLHMATLNGAEVIGSDFST
jgi:uncharacterized protein YjbI with pentapeptide repeats